MTLEQTIQDAIADVADEVRNGASTEDTIAEVAGDYEISVAVLTARFERAYPNGVPSAIPDVAEMEERAREARLVERQRQIDEHNAIVSFFNANPDITNRVRKSIRKETGRASLTAKEAMVLAHKIGEI